MVAAITGRWGARRNSRNERRETRSVSNDSFSSLAIASRSRGRAARILMLLWRQLFMDEKDRLPRRAAYDDMSSLLCSRSREKARVDRPRGAHEGRLGGPRDLVLTCTKGVPPAQPAIMTPWPWNSPRLRTERSSAVNAPKTLAKAAGNFE